MIAKVDHHMWRCTASILADRKGVHDDLLTLMGCKLFQGYYFAKPMPREEFERFLLETNSSAGDENRSSTG